jgi:hypothetical protein
MTKGSLFWSLPVAVSLFVLSGCSNTVRYLTPMTWLRPPPGAAASATGSPTDGRTLYVTYWEGSCMPKILPFLGGCTLGDSKIRRCNLKPDNQMECVDEVEATQAFARQK